MAICVSKAAMVRRNLNYEIEQWNPAGNSYVWVQVPRFTNNCSVLAQWGGFTGSTAPAYTTNGATWSNGFSASGI